MKRLLSVLAMSAVAVLLVAVPAALSQEEDPFPDTDGDGIPDPPAGEPGDLDIRPGSGAVSARLQDQIERAGDLQSEDIGAFIDGICGGWAISYDADGQQLDRISRFKEGGPIIDWSEDGGDGVLETGMTADNPFVVDSRGVVIYYGELENEGGDGPRDHEWAILTGGISLDAGGDDNPDGNNRNAGRVDLGASLPVPISATAKVTGTLTAENGANCEGAGFVEFRGGNPIATPAGAAGGLFAVAGFLGLLFNSRPAYTWRA